ncbi:T6SS effector BTH_I2691 family protein [Cupriavidus taiwanensis]|uniref:Toxin VasX N-terminal region domain-containing protein n=1 Tax=Cupriavidus taiwanensis (strain DSM 17343 / BCRC 17206 / CCUG 44338 / CIP 107171 / LMG 19424 / R1) TaxID=977880 RepID=B3R9Q6_CUPTR|nr:T6SS effector BTH_I2691 family protein [Cupriavidus taiwanensis]CAQ71631.1 conserved hypothetical protein; putative membrane protein [Cupriavidus taiwanensis LMG 19424]
MTQSGTTPKNNKAGCPFCLKKGLPILPVRYAIARDDIGKGKPAPRLGGPFGHGVQENELPAGQHYTLRLMRPGYLYVCNEKRGSWDAYVITEKGYLYPFATEIKHSVLEKMDTNKVQTIDALLQPPKEAIEFSCQREPDHPYLARCIMVPDASSAERIWIGFSDTPWTKRVWKAHTNARERARHMRELRLDLWKGGSHRHVDSLEKLGGHLSEGGYTIKETRPEAGKRGTYPSEMAGQPSAFSHSPQAFYGLREQLPGLVNWANSQAKRMGMIAPMLAVDDPVGLALEAAQLLRLRVEIFERDKGRDWKHATSTTIVGMRHAIEEQAVQEALQVKRNTSGVAVYTYADGMPVATPYDPDLEEKVWEQNGLMALTPDEEKRARRNAWKEYLNDYSEPNREAFDKELERDMNAYARNTLAPLARSFVTWYGGTPYREAMACNHDDTDIKSGEAMTSLVIACLYDIVGIEPVSDILLKELQGSFTERKNTVLRALVLDNSEAAKKLEKAATAELEVGNPGAWSNVFKAFAHVLEKGHANELAGAMESVARLAYSVSAPIVTLLGRAGRGAVGKAGDAVVGVGVRYRHVALLGLLAKKPLRQLKIRASEAEMAHIIVDELVRAHPNVDRQALRRQVDNHVRSELSERRGARGQIPGARNARGRRVYEWTVFWDDDMRRTFNGTNIDQLDNILLREDQLRAALRSRTATAIKLDIGLGTVGLILDGWNAYKAYTELPDPKKGTLGQRQLQLAGALTSLAGSSIELTGKGFERTAWGRTSLVRPFRFFMNKVSSRALLVGFLGKLIGTIGAFMGSILDYWKAKDAKAQGDVAMYRLYITTSVVGGAIASLMLFGLLSAGLGFVLLLALALVSMLGEWMINVIRDNKVEIWLDKTPFGMHKHGRFLKLDEQESAYQSLLKA